MKRRTSIAAVAIACAVFGAAAAAPPAGATVVRKVSERVFPFRPGGEIKIESQNGRIVVEAWDRPDVRVQITREVRATSVGESETLLKQLSADITVHPDQIQIVSVYPKQKKVVGIWDWLGHGARSVNIHYYLQVPRQSSLDLATSNGEIRVRATEGWLDAGTTNGDIEVSGVRGSVNASTTNGQVRLARIQGMADATTTNGSVEVEILALPDKGKMQISSTNGNLALTLPRDVRATLEAETTNGRVNIGYPLTTQGVTSSKSIRGTIGGGGARIALETTNGNVDVGPPSRAATP
jgi:putative adhesin